MCRPSGEAAGRGRSIQVCGKVYNRARPGNVRAACAAHDFVHIIASPRPGSALMQRTAVAAPWLVVLGFPPPPAQGRGQTPPGPAPATLAERVQQVIGRPEYRRSSFGVAFYDLDANTPVFTLNADKLFVPGSTTKLVTEGTGLELLGPDYRFHTRLYRTGPIRKDGTLDGDLVLVASGDPNLSGRIRPDGTLAFENQDHAYDGSPDTKAVPGDPLLVIHELADQVAARHITRVKGHVLIDISLFPEGERELGTGVVISPVAVNDNLVAVTVAPGAAPAGSPPCAVAGGMPAGKPAWLFSYAVPQPSRFAEVVLVEALARRGVRVPVSPFGVRHDFKALAAAYTPDNLVAEHVSPPLTEEAKVTLKVSQNLHASMMPFILSGVLAHDGSAKAGFKLEHDLLERAGLDLSGASQGDGAGGAAHFAPEFMVRFLAYMSSRPYFPAYLAALPVLGRDGTLWKVQPDSPAAGHVQAKTGTYAEVDHLNGGLMVNGKGLAGYVTTAAGRRLAFAVYANNVPVSAEQGAIERTIAQAVGEIAAAAYGAASPGEK